MPTDLYIRDDETCGGKALLLERGLKKGLQKKKAKDRQKVVSDSPRRDWDDGGVDQIERSNLESRLVVFHNMTSSPLDQGASVAANV